VEAVQSARWSGSHGLGNPPIPTGLAGPPGVLAPKLKPVWPPSFETDGGAYIFQAQSGSFLEPKSQFFYCPKSRLYYSCADGIYYNCVVSSTEVNFIRFNPPLPLEPDSGLITENADVSEKSTTEVEVTAQRKPVVLSMGFNMGKGKNASVKIINVATKKATGDILKWGAVQVQEDNPAEINRALSSGASRGKGKSSSVILENSTTPISAATSVSVKDTVEPTRAFNSSTVNSGFSPDPRIAIVTAASSAADAVALITGIAPAPAPALPVTVASAEPELVACLLCRRQFASPEQLLRHERESKLHKDNMILAVKAASDDLARQLAAYSASSSNVPEHSAQEIQDASTLSEGYRDRASERRETHRPSDETAGTMYRDRERGRERKKEDTREHRKSSQRHETESQSVPSSSLQDSSNPGTQMLRKMGWNEGQGLGRGGSGAEESVGVLLASDINSNSGKRVQGIGVAAAPQTILYHGSGREYKESLLRAAKARYDQVNSN
jgi:G-patch domain/OCRE domain